MNAVVHYGRFRRPGRISMISIDVQTKLGRKTAMTSGVPQTPEELLASLNADLHRRDPVHVMTHQIRAKTLDEVRQRLRDARSPDGADAAVFDRLDVLIERLAVTPARA
jgi:hypothetical protein